MAEEQETIDFKKIENILNALNQILAILGTVDLDELKTWVEAENKWKEVRNAGHENEDKE